MTQDKIIISLNSETVESGEEQCGTEARMSSMSVEIDEVFGQELDF